MVKIGQLAIIILGVFWITFPHRISAQDDSVSVPNLAGLSAPKAAATLNRVGLNLGAQNNVAWTSASPQPQNTISAQSIAAGQTAKRGSAVDITVVRGPNLILLYSNKLLTLLNQTGATLDLTALTFKTVDGSKPVTFGGSQWQANEIENTQCAQVAAERRQGPEAVQSCSAIPTWFWTTNTGTHFWIGINSVTQFSVTQTGTQRGICQAAQVGAESIRCELYVTSSAGEDTAEYVYFAYTKDQLLVVNKSTDKWMPLAGASITNRATAVAGSTLEFADPKVFTAPVTIGQTNLLAPGQCLLFTNRNVQSTTTPESCDIVARLDLESNVVFWALEFGVNSVTDDAAHVCPAATPDKLTVCIMPR